MEEINGHIALKKIEEICKIGGDFSIGFISYSRTLGELGGLKSYPHCTLRAQLPHEKWSIDGKNFLLFDTEDGQKTCYKVLIRYIGFPADGYKLKKIKWYE